MSNINKQAQKIISDIRLKQGSDDFYAPIIRWDEFKVIAGALEAAEKRIAELESREVVIRQFDEFSICHFGGSEDYAKGYIDCQKNYNKALGAASILVSIKGE